MSADPAADPFGTAALRRVVLDAWAASPARFREDANAEESLAVGGYAGRVLVELASNAVDAARELGVPPRIRLRLRDGELRVANTGRPLTEAGVSALASLRASAKRDFADSVGHFGVGFTAVLSWSQRPMVVSTTGGIRFDPFDTRSAIAALGNAALSEEVRRRDGQVPVLRLPWPADPDEEPPPPGYATEVRLPLASGARAEVDRLLADPGTADDLFWALTDLAEIDLPDRVVRRRIDDAGLTVIDDGRSIHRYRTADRSGELPSALLVGRPVEERRRTRWRVSWVLPVDPPEADPGDDLSSAVQAAARTSGPLVQRTTIGAPTPTDEPLTLPARLIGTFPVDDTRRRLAKGPLADHLLDEAAAGYLDLLAGTEPENRWMLLPGTGFPAGPIDAAVREAVLRRVSVTPLLATAAGDLVTPADACLLPGLGAPGAALFGQAIPGLLPPQGSAAAHVLRGLGVQTLSWSQASSALAGLEREAAFWWQVYDAVATADRPPAGDDLADIPVPLTGGRRAFGARGCLLAGATAGAGPDGGSAGAGIDPELAVRVGRLVLALRIVDPAAGHPVLERLGARPADAGALLADPAVLDAIREVRRELEDGDPDPDDVVELGTAVLDLLLAGGGEGPAGDAANGRRKTGDALADLVLTDDDGQPWPAAELLIPGAALAAVLDPGVERPVVGPEWTDRYPREVLLAAGVRAGFATVTVADPSIDNDLPDLPDLDEWLDRFPLDPGGAFTALADLDLVDPQRWEQALQLIAGDRATRDCLLPTGSGPSYSGWWLSRHALIGGHPPTHWRLPTAVDLDGLYDPLPTRLDPLIARGIGVRTALADAAAEDPTGLLERLADPARWVPPGRVAALTRAVVAALADIDDVDLPPGVRTMTGEVVDADAVCVLDLPWLAQVVPPRRLVPGGPDPALVSRVLDLPAASDAIRVSMVQDAGPAEVPDGVPAEPDRAGRPEPPGSRIERAAAAVGVRAGDLDIVVRPALRVAVDGEQPITVRWWGSSDRQVVSGWVDGSAEAIGRAVAWAAGCWSDRHRAIAAADDDPVALAEDALG